MSTGELADLVREVSAPAVAGLGLLVEEVGITPAGRRRIVRVTLDRDLSGLDQADEATPVPPVCLDDIASASTAVDAALEGSGALGDQPYVLEVSSPGVGRPLTLPRHYRRNVGRLVQVTCTDGSSVTGRLTRVGAEDLSLAVSPARGSAAADRTLRFGELASACVQVEFNRSEGPGGDEAEEAG
ncbi:MAG TPA: ribosome maturation factor RimP [Dermatophilaceae bacterium]|nr:ribosome maturation factor RimP [Dermatophilaceae bacterium]